MNPRRRRLLIPGLLVVLIVIVVAVSIGRQAEASEGPAEASEPIPLGVISDARITESSGLAISADDPDLAYTINDSGHADVIYAIELSTGDVVGVTTVAEAGWRDTEALALHDGTLWVADTGDNLGQRDDIALWSLDEPGRGDATVGARQHRIAYPDGPRDVESLAIDPDSGRKLLITKQLLGGELLELPADLTAGEVTTATATGIDALAMATDAAWTPDGRHVVIRNYTDAQVIDAETGDVTLPIGLPEQPQGESLAVAPDGASVVVGSEGANSQLWRIDLPIQSSEPRETGSDANDVSADRREPIPDEALSRRWLTPVLALGALGGLVLASVWMARRPKRRRRRR